MPTADSLHLLFDCISAGVLLGGSIIGLMIKNALNDIRLAQATDKAELLANQVAVQADLTRHNSEVKQELAVHSEKDDGRFAGQGARLDVLAAAQGDTNRKLDIMIARA